MTSTRFPNQGYKLLVAAVVLGLVPSGLRGQEATTPGAPVTMEPDDPAGALPNAEAAPATSPSVTVPEFREEGDWLVLGGIRLNKLTHELRISVELALTEGILEYLLVDGKGKTYESVFELNGNKPSELNFALLLAGVESLDFGQLINWIKEQQAQTGSDKPEAAPGAEADPAKPESPRAQSSPDYSFAGNALLEIKLYDGEGAKHIPWDHVIRPRAGTLPARWLFVSNGSYFTSDGRFVADMNLSYIALWRDPSALINFISFEENPYRTNGGFEINKENATLTKGQKFELRLLPVKK